MKKKTQVENTQSGKKYSDEIPAVNLKLLKHKFQKHILYHTRWLNNKKTQCQNFKKKCEKKLKTQVNQSNCKKNSIEKKYNTSKSHAGKNSILTIFSVEKKTQNQWSINKLQTQFENKKKNAFNMSIWKS